mmetsp:Transcript_36602/g.77145  ORF Transcript_36602/g.77145 Transcript_36602/m.77145 type:complete len:519 (+) Transcript_36602:302-1858(+)
MDQVETEAIRPSNPNACRNQANAPSANCTCLELDVHIVNLDVCSAKLCKLTHKRSSIGARRVSQQAAPRARTACLTSSLELGGVRNVLLDTRCLAAIVRLNGAHFAHLALAPDHCLAELLPVFHARVAVDLLALARETTVLHDLSSSLALLTLDARLRRRQLPPLFGLRRRQRRRRRRPALLFLLRLLLRRDVERVVLQRDVAAVAVVVAVVVALPRALRHRSKLALLAPLRLGLGAHCGRRLVAARLLRSLLGALLDRAHVLTQRVELLLARVHLLGRGHLVQVAEVVEGLQLVGEGLRGVALAPLFLELALAQVQTREVVLLVRATLCLRVAQLRHHLRVGEDARDIVRVDPARRLRQLVAKLAHHPRGRRPSQSALLLAPLLARAGLVVVVHCRHLGRLVELRLGLAVLALVLRLVGAVEREHRLRIRLELELLLVRRQRRAVRRRKLQQLLQPPLELVLDRAQPLDEHAVAQQRVDHGVLSHRAAVGLEHEVKGDVNAIVEKKLELELQEEDAL